MSLLLTRARDLVEHLAGRKDLSDLNEDDVYTRLEKVIDYQWQRQLVARVMLLAEEVQKGEPAEGLDRYTRRDAGDYGWNHALIVLDDEGPTWSNQTGGPSCNHPEARGHLYDLPEPKTDQGLCLCGGGWPDFDRIFAASGYPFRLDREAHFTEEAWVGVVLNDGRKGIFVYNNCD